MLESPVVKSYLLRIELLYAHRPIWRELWVPSNITLEFLHDVIQDSMGWDDAHMHCFEFQKRRFESMQFMDGFDAAEVTEDLKEMVEEFESFDQELDQIFGEEDKDDIFTAGLPGPSGPRRAGGFLPGF